MKCNYILLLSATLISSILLTTQRDMTRCLQARPRWLSGGGFKDRKKKKRMKSSFFNFFLFGRGAHYFLKGLPGEFNKCHGTSQPSREMTFCLSGIRMRLIDWLIMKNKPYISLIWRERKMRGHIYFFSNGVLQYCRQVLVSEHLSRVSDSEAFLRGHVSVWHWTDFGFLINTTEWFT